MFSLINVSLNANVDQFETNMHRAADIADASMGRAAANAEEFQTAFDRAATAAGQSADRMAGEFESANERAAKSTDQLAASMQAVNDAANDVDARSWSEKISSAMAAGFGAGAGVAQTWMDRIEEFVKTKLVLLGVALVAGITLAAATAIYTAYKIISGSLGFLTGLFTGDSYKSQNIDALIALNHEVKTLQDGLHVSAIEASALNEALKGQGVDKGSYIATLNAAASAVHSNTDELDRLGVKYKDANGALLPFATTLANARIVLDSYTEGWDRNQAAVAIGMGSYQDISDAVSITSEKVETAKQRLIDYGLIIGPGTQEAVSAYEASMRAFQRETDLTAQGFKKAIADQVMPLLTDLADFFRDGFPGVVSAFRYSMATITSLFYGLKEAAYVASESILESFGAIGDMLGRVAQSFWKVLHGDFAGAWAELKAVPDDLGKRWEAYWANLNAQSERNVKAMKLAWGFDNFVAAASPTHTAVKQGKSWVPPPDAAEAVKVEDVSRQILDGRLKALERAISSENALLTSRAAMLKAFYDRGLIGESDYYERLASVEDTAHTNDVAFYDAEIKAIGEYQAKYDKGSKEWIEAANRMADVQDKIAAADQKAAEASIRLWLEESATWAQTGMDKALGDYLKSAGETASNVGNLFRNAFKGMEDALVNFVKTGKLDFKSLVDSIITDLIRMQVQASFTAPLAKAMSGFSWASLTSLFSAHGNVFSGGQLQAFAGGGAFSNQVVSSPTAFNLGVMGEAGPEAILPLTRTAGGQLGVQAAGGGGVVVNIYNNSSGTQATTRQRDQGGVRIIDVLVEQVKNSVAGDIAHGNGPIPRVIENTYGLNRAAGAY